MFPLLQTFRFSLISIGRIDKKVNILCVFVLLCWLRSVLWGLINGNSGLFQEKDSSGTRKPSDRSISEGFN
jgi:hypothetical protein